MTKKKYSEETLQKIGDRLSYRDLNPEFGYRWRTASRLHQEIKGCLGLPHLTVINVAQMLNAAADSGLVSRKFDSFFDSGPKLPHFSAKEKSND